MLRDPVLLQKLSRALQAIVELFEREFVNRQSLSWSEGLEAEFEITQTPIPRRLMVFHGRFVPLRKQMVELLVTTYRAIFKVALAHESQIGIDPDVWAQLQLQPAVELVLNWIPEWYVLACDGENESVRHHGPVPFTPGQTVSFSISSEIDPRPPLKSWQAPVWLFGISPLFGFRGLKEQHVPARDSDEKLGKAHTRLLLKGARRVFLWELAAEIQRVRNEEIATASAVFVQSAVPVRRINKRKGAEQREKLYEVIRKLLSVNPNLRGIHFCHELDKRHAPPLWDWTKSGSWKHGLTWKEAWNDSKLRSKIRRVRQEAQRLS